jgi:LemA protein
MVGLYITIGVVVLLVLWVISAYNGFVKSRLMVDNNYSQIKIQCKKRFDLVPNLVETVKGYAKHEKDTLENVINARNRGASANSPEALAVASNQLTQTLGKLFALSEAYPDLKANVNFSNLQSELVSLEKAIAVSRQFYNDTVMMYNRRIMVFPSNILAGVFRFNAAEFFEASAEETQNVKVSF